MPPKRPSKPAPPTLSAATRIAVLYGPERFLLNAYTQQLRDALAEAYGPDGVDTVAFDGATTPPADILDECRSFGLMQQHKLVLVDNADALLKTSEDEEGEKPVKPARAGPAPRTARQLFESYAAAPSENATLVLRAETWRAGNLDKLIDAAGGAVVKCEAPGFEDAVVWTIARCKKRHGTSIGPEAAELLVSFIGPDLSRIDTELAKLALYDPGPPPRPITADLVRMMVGVAREDEFWAIQRTLLRGDPVAALAHLREAIEVSRHDPVALTWSFSDLARKLHGAAQGLAQGRSPGSMIGPLKLFGGLDGPVFQAARRIGPERAAALFRAAVETDVRQKTGLGDPVRNLEALAVRFASVLG